MKATDEHRQVPHPGDTDPRSAAGAPREQPPAGTAGMPRFAGTGLPEIDVGSPLPALPTAPEHVFVRLWGRPLGVTDLRAALEPAELAEVLWTRFGSLIRRALVEGGLEPIRVLTAAGIETTRRPSWYDQREELARAGEPISVVLCTRDRPEMLDHALASLTGLRYHDVEIIVVDNAPTSDATSDVVHRHMGGRIPVRYIREMRPGLSFARNAGLAATDRAYIAYTDDDVIVDEHWVTELMRGFQAAPHVGCVTGQVLPHSLASDVDRWRESYAGADKLGFQRRVFDLVAGGSSSLYPFTTGECGFGMNMAFRTEVLRSFGGFETALGAGTRTGGGEDLAAFFEVIVHEWRLVYEPGALLCHVHRTTFAELAKQMSSWGRGFTAYLTYALTRQPAMTLKLAARGVRGVIAAVSPRSTKNRTKPGDYPASLTRTELAGMPLGPLAYLLARRDRRRIERAAPSLGRTT